MKLEKYNSHMVPENGEILVAEPGTCEHLLNIDINVKFMGLSSQSNDAMIPFPHSFVWFLTCLGDFLSELECPERPTPIDIHVIMIVVCWSNFH